jgi:signal transduction histidine kinase
MLEFASWKPRLLVSLGLFFAATGAMGYLRLHVFPDQFITLTYALPLLICLWYPSLRLLWSMATAFIGMSAYKAFALLPSHQLFVEENTVHWVMQVVNILLVASTLNIVLVILGRLRAANVTLEESNQELAARDEEISRQNEELQAQTAELSEQNEEIQQQSEELQQQSEEVHAQAEELQAINAELSKRQELLENLLQSLHDVRGPEISPDQLCGPLLHLFRGAASVAVVVLRDGDDVVVQAQAGEPAVDATRWPFASSFTAVAMEQDKVAGVADLALRPDFNVARPAGGRFRAVLAAPLRLAGRPAGAIELYSNAPCSWTREHFHILEWSAAQGSLIMEARRLHQQLVAANAGLDRLVQARTAELQELVTELEHFSYTITHDLRAPLRAMHGFAQFLEEESGPQLDDQARGYLRRIAVAARRMDQLISDALSYSKAVRLELAMSPTDPVALLRGMIESYPAFQPPKARIELPASMPQVVANEAALTQCFSNLLDNAVKFVPAGRTPHVKVQAEERDGMVRLCFQDNGIGIPSDMQHRLFVMFQRLSKEYEGTGIGLALVRKVAERMGGRVGVESEPGSGSRFWLELKRGH